MIQIYVKLSDIKRNPKETFEWGMKYFPKLPEWFHDMQKNGFKVEKPITLNWKGCILDGNQRYEMARLLNENKCSECHREPIPYVPIDYSFLAADWEAFVEIQSRNWTREFSTTDNKIMEVKRKIKELQEDLKGTDSTELKNLYSSMLREAITPEYMGNVIRQDSRVKKLTK